MPNFSGLWTVTQQMQAKGVCTWTAPPGATTIGTATAGGSLCASVTFTAPVYTGNPAGITGYKATSTPGCITATGASSPLVVPGLSNTVSYTFKVAALGASGYGLCSAASNSITAKAISQQAYTAAGTYTWVAPTSVTSVSVVVVGPGGGKISRGSEGTAGGGGGALAYVNNITVIPGNSYTVIVGAAAVSGASGNSTFINSGTLGAQGGQGAGVPVNSGGVGGTVITGTGGNGGNGASVGGASSVRSGAGGAGGYAGNGGNGSGLGSAGIAGAGGGGGGGTAANDGVYRGGAGGGVGILGQGANGAGGISTVGLQNGSAGSGGSSVSYGGGGNPCDTNGGSGAVRIIWPGTTRSFPSTCTGNL